VVLKTLPAARYLASWCLTSAGSGTWCARGRRRGTLPGAVLFLRQEPRERVLCFLGFQPGPELGRFVFNRFVDLLAVCPLEHGLGQPQRVARLVCDIVGCCARHRQ